MENSPQEPTGQTSTVKAAMREWAAQHPEEAAQRHAARDRQREQRKAAKVLSELIGPAMIEKAAERLDELLDAQQPVVVNLPPVVDDGKIVSGGQEVQFVSDNKTRLEAVKVVAAYTEGLPIQRQVQITGDFKDLTAETKNVLLGSSAVLEALADLDASGIQFEEAPVVVG